MTTILILGIILFCCFEWWTFRGKCDSDGKAFKAIAEWMKRQENINCEIGRMHLTRQLFRNSRFSERTNSVSRRRATRKLPMRDTARQIRMENREEG